MPGFDRLGSRAIARRWAAVPLAASVVLAGCTAGDDAPDRDGARDRFPRPEPLRAQLASPADATTVVPAEGAGGMAAAASAALYAEAPVVVLAPEGDAAALDRAARTAVALGMPLLLTPPEAPGDPGDPGDPGEPGEPGEPGVAEPAAEGALAGASHDAARGAAAPAPGGPPGQAAEPAGEVRRLSPQAVLAFGAPAARWAEDEAAGVAVVAAPGAADARRALDGELPPLGDAEPVDEVLVVLPGDGTATAARATAEAAGARVVTISGDDPRADPTAIADLAAEPLPERVVALGAGFGPADRLRRRLEVAATGVELPGGGQVVFPGRRLVALYGHPGTPALGVLGEQAVDAAIARARETAAGYGGLVAEPVVPAFEIITTVATAAPGPDGDYSAESTVEDLRPWVDAARAAGVYVVLDLQPGRTDFLTQAQRYEELLAEPHVGLALDPEWRLGPDQRHLAQIGSVGADEVNAVAEWLAALTRRHRLPQKLLLLHQFQLRMIADRARVATGHDDLAVLVHADGFGTPGQKLETWRALRSEPLPGAWWGWKNFIDEDRPTFTPAQTVAVDPVPWFVSYQ
ncbi:MAG TPA: hypothetical protein VFZ77_14935 [Acidimicrobiales bacterium]